MRHLVTALAACVGWAGISHAQGLISADSIPAGAGAVTSVTFDKVAASQNPVLVSSDVQNQNAIHASYLLDALTFIGFVEESHTTDNGNLYLARSVAGGYLQVLENGNTFNDGVELTIAFPSPVTAFSVTATNLASIETEAVASSGKPATYTFIVSKPVSSVHLSSFSQEIDLSGVSFAAAPSASPSSASVPEPSSILLLSGGVIGFGFVRGRRGW